MKIFVLILLFLPSLLLAQHDVIYDQIGANRMFIFSTKTRPGMRLGEIKAGKTIVILYAIYITQNGRARFVALDASKLSSKQQRKLKTLLVAQSDGQKTPFGYIIKDANNPTLEIYINPKLLVAFRKRVGGAGHEAIAREGNLNVTIIRVKSGYKILRADVE